MQSMTQQALAPSFVEHPGVSASAVARLRRAAGAVRPGAHRQGLAAATTNSLTWAKADLRGKVVPGNKELNKPPAGRNMSVDTFTEIRS